MIFNLNIFLGIDNEINCEENESLERRDSFDESIPILNKVIIV